jgi:ribosomal protein L11 methyltransferase
VDQSIAIPSRWIICPPGHPSIAGKTCVFIEPGVGFGDGTHPTTQLCLQAIAALAPRGRTAWRLLDFGSGTGILAIGAARLGAVVDAVEIDVGAIAEAEHNTGLNAVADRVHLSRTLDGVSGPFELVVANILRPVLIEHACSLTERLAVGGALVLSGLVATDVPAVSARYTPLLGGRRPDVVEQDGWRALAWRG